MYNFHLKLRRVCTVKYDSAIICKSIRSLRYSAETIADSRVPFHIPSTISPNCSGVYIHTYIYTLVRIPLLRESKSTRNYAARNLGEFLYACRARIVRMRTKDLIHYELYYVIASPPLSPVTWTTGEAVCFSIILPIYSQHLTRT